MLKKCTIHYYSEHLLSLVLGIQLVDLPSCGRAERIDFGVRCTDLRVLSTQQASYHLSHRYHFSKFYRLFRPGKKSSGTNEQEDTEKGEVKIKDTKVNSAEALFVLMNYFELDGYLFWIDSIRFYW